MRKRYDTEGIVGRLQSERRKALLLSLGGAAVLVIVFVVMLTTGGDPSQVEQGRQAAQALQPTAAQPRAAEPAPAAPAAPQRASAAPPTPAAAMLTIVSPRPAQISIDDVVVAKNAREHTATLPAGKHKVLVRAGKKPVLQSVEVEAGKRYKLEVDPKKKKPTLETLGS